jgi:2'-hydroxyisoflavone reductase
VIDVRDLAAFAINAAESNFTGTCNVVSHPNDFRFGELVDYCIKAAKKQAKPDPAPHATWINADFLEAQQVAPWSEMPAWLPAKGDEAAFASTSNAAAVARGLRISPLRKTVDDTLAWHLTRPAAERDKLKAGIAPDKEATVLAAWKARASG